MVSIDENLIINHFDSLSKIGLLGSSPSEGFLRAGWSDDESFAFEYINGYSVSRGMFSRYDNLGNLFIRTSDKDEKIIQIGSHLDTVPYGGNYDGTSGIVAGLEAMLAMKNIGKCIELVIWRGEESATYGISHKGSMSALGILPPDALSRKFLDKTLEQAIISQGFNPDYIKNGIPTLTYMDNIIAHLELHIEQGNKLEQNKKDIGNVTDIRGFSRYLVEVNGEFDHSGATPMGVKYRRDSNLSIAYMQVRLNELAKKYLPNNDLVQTVGELNTCRSATFDKLQYNALTKVSGFGYFTLDIRSNNNAFKQKYLDEANNIINETASEFNVKVNITGLSSSNAISLSSELQSHIDRACKDLNYSVISMSSGASHDAAIMARQTYTDGKTIPVGMIFIPCLNGKSHCKEEYTSMASITKGANVLAKTIEYIATNQNFIN